MGIKGIYGEIGPGERIALPKLAIEKYEKTGRPLRIAIDVSIWQFQIQAGQGGSNPAIRTLYYRLVRLLSASVQPLFVFDGPRKPTFKRNKRSSHHGGSLSNVLTKQLLKLFGFPSHTAPGEAEAECALLQREGIVDAVLSEDVDTLMFGCGLTLRNWSAEGSRGNHAPTHVSVYDAQMTKAGKAGLDREGMILIAMMSGGDYITEGIPGCGIKVACEAARAGFGKYLCRISRSDTAGLDTWRNRLAHEIQTNESGYFRTKHKALKIPDTFPNKEVLGYYTHPIVSSASKINNLKEEIIWDGEIDIQKLRMFVAETFEWVNRTGADKFIRSLAPALLVHKLRLRGDRDESDFDDLILTAMNEMEMVRAICGKRVHFSTDGMPELRVIYHPNDIVGLDLNVEADGNEDYGRDGLAPVNDDDEIEAYASDPPPPGIRSASPTKRSASTYDPTLPDKLWILETIAKVGVPLKVEDYESSLRDPKKSIAAKSAAKRAATKKGTKPGTMDKFVKTSKPGVKNSDQTISKVPAMSLNMPNQLSSPPPVARRPEKPVLSQSAPVSTSSRNSHPTRSSARTSAENVASKPKTKKKASTEKPGQNTNHWTLAQSSPTSRSVLPITKPLVQPRKLSSPTAGRQSVSIDLCSSVESSPCYPGASPNTPRKHTDATQDNSFSLITPPNDGTLDSSSPRKKRPVESPSKNTPPQRPLSPSHLLTPEPMNRKIDFQASVSRARSSSPDFPTLEELFPAIESRSGGAPLGIDDAGSSDEHFATPARNPSISSRSREPEITTITSSPPVPRSPVITSPHLPAEVSQAEDPKPQPPKVARGKKYLMLRESLPGSWKEVDESSVRGRKGRAWRQSQVEVLDMTED